MGQLAAQIGLVLEDVEAQLFSASVADEVAFGLEGLGLPPPEIEARIRSALELVGLSGLEQRVPRTLSGGQQKRLALAAVLAMRPRLLILDEPTSGLDPISTSKVENALVELKQHYTIVIVPHSVQQAARVADHAAFFLMGELVEQQPGKAIFAQPKDQRTEDYVTGRFG